MRKIVQYLARGTSRRVGPDHVACRPVLVTRIVFIGKVSDCGGPFRNNRIPGALWPSLTMHSIPEPGRARLGGPGRSTGFYSAKLRHPNTSPQDQRAATRLDGVLGWQEGAGSTNDVRTHSWRQCFWYCYQRIRLWSAAILDQALLFRNESLPNVGYGTSDCLI